MNFSPISPHSICSYIVLFLWGRDVALHWSLPLPPPEMGIGNGGGGLVASFGEMLIDFVPTEAGVSLAEATVFLKAPGGAPANVAIAVTRLGGRSAFVGKLGDDEFGRMLAAILRENGVSDSGVVFDASARTALAFVTLRADGEREFMFYRNPSADMLLTVAELNVDLIKEVNGPALLLLRVPLPPSYLNLKEKEEKQRRFVSHFLNLTIPFLVFD